MNVPDGVKQRVNFHGRLSLKHEDAVADVAETYHFNVKDALVKGGVPGTDDSCDGTLINHPDVDLAGPILK